MTEYPETPEYFYSQGAGTGRLQHVCKECWRRRGRESYAANRDYHNKRVVAARRRRQFRIAGVEGEPQACQACGAPPSDRRNAHAQHGPHGLAFDHDHGTGAFRGWLCAHCNRALGLMDDDPELLRRLAAYVEARAVAAPEATMPIAAVR